jgi:hypothetical protein
MINAAGANQKKINSNLESSDKAIKNDTYCPQNSINQCSNQSHPDAPLLVEPYILRSSVEY